MTTRILSGLVAGTRGGRHHQWGRSLQMYLVYTIWPGTSGSGWRTSGTRPTPAGQVTDLQGRTEPINGVCYGADRGMPADGSSGARTGSSSYLAIASTILAFVVPETKGPDPFLPVDVVGRAFEDSQRDEVYGEESALLVLTLFHSTIPALFHFEGWPDSQIEP